MRARKGVVEGSGSYPFARQFRTSLNPRAVAGQTFFCSPYLEGEITVAAVCYGEGGQTEKQRQVELKANEICSALNHLSHIEGKADGDEDFGDALRARILGLHAKNSPPEDLPKPQKPRGSLHCAAV